MTRRGLTLIAALAVVILLGIIAATAATNVAVTADAAARRALVAQLQSLDASGRAAARVSTAPVMMVVTDNEVALRSVDTISARALPPGSSLELRADHHSIRSLSFDRRGRTRDYDAQLTWPSGEQASWTVAGMTGLVMPEERTP